MNQVSFCGGETAGSVGKRDLASAKNHEARRIQTPQHDIINFRGTEEKDSSIASNLAKVAVGGVLTFGALGYAHRNGYINKITNANIRKYLNIVAEPCHEGCAAITKFGRNCYSSLTKMFK